MLTLPSEVDYLGHQRWRDAEGRVHRDGGLPAVEYADGGKEWRVRGERHRDDGLPAINYADGSNAWWVHGQRHRDGGLPAIEWANGDKEWYVRGQRHRDGGLPAIERADGSKQWYVRGERHRDGGLPAVVYSNGLSEWWVFGKRHRGQGLPAVEYGDGHVFTGFFWGVGVTQAHARQIHRLLANRARRQRWKKARLFLQLTRSKAFVEWFYAPDRMGGRWAKKDLARFASSL